jgi:hypothetical protein
MRVNKLILYKKKKESNFKNNVGLRNNKVGIFSTARVFTLLIQFTDHTMDVAEKHCSFPHIR